MLKNIVTVLALFFCFLGNTQDNLNNYKYIIVPLQYDFLKENDKFRLNTLTRYLFKQNGFIVFFENEKMPEDLNDNRCKALNVNVEKSRAGLFATKLEISITDCNQIEVFRSRTGVSRAKDYKEAYTEALKNAFISIEELDYKYEVKEETNVNVSNAKEETVNNDRDNSSIYINKQIDSTTNESEIATSKSIDKIEFFYAKRIVDGYQLINTDSKLMMILLSTSVKNVYLVKDKNAIIYKKDEVWYHSENDGNKEKTHVLEIKF